MFGDINYDLLINIHPNRKTSEMPREKGCIALVLIASLVEVREVGKLLARYLAVCSAPTFAKRNMRKRFNAHVLAHFNQLAPCLVITPDIITLGCRPRSSLCFGYVPITLYHPSRFHDNNKRPPRYLTTLFLFVNVIHSERECQPCCVKLPGFRV